MCIIKMDGYSVGHSLRASQAPDELGIRCSFLSSPSLWVSPVSGAIRHNMLKFHQRAV